MAIPLAEFNNNAFVLDALRDAEWITAWTFDDATKTYSFHWTKKGKERKQWIKTIGAEIPTNLTMLTGVFSLCGCSK